MNKDQALFLEKIYALWGGILVVWAIYRYFFRFSEVVDELLIKPLVFVAPVLLFVHFKEKRTLESVGIRFNKIIRDLYLGLGFGILFTIVGIATNFVKHGGLSLNPVVSVTGETLMVTLALSLVTAFWEELLIRGFFFTRLVENYKKPLKAMFISSIMYLLILVPIILTRLHLRPYALFLLVGTNIMLSFANTLLFSETKSLTLPTLIHAFWNMAVVLYL